MPPESNVIYQKNIQALRQHHPLLAQQIESVKDVPAVVLKKTETGELNIACQFADGKSIWLYPEASPQHYSQEFITKTEFQNPRMLVFLGFGLGLHLLEYLKNPHPINQVILVFEAQPHFFKKALEVSDFSHLFSSKNIQWLVGSDPQKLQIFLNEFYSQGPWLMLANAIDYINFPPSCESSPSYYLAIQEALPQALGHHFNRVFSDPYDAYRGAQNIFKNLKSIIAMPSFWEAKDFLKGKPAILIASGPSLSEALPILQQLQDRVMMIACPSALSLLIKNKIYPHLWINIERDEIVGDIFKDLIEKPPHVFVAPPLVHPKCFEENAGLNTFLLSQGLLAQWLPLPGDPIDFGHSAANAAFRTLQVLGASEIFLVGQDLSYSQDDQGHAEGVWEITKKFSQDFQTEGRRLLSVEGNNGKPIQTNIYWHTYLKTFSEQLIPSFSGKVFNAIAENYGAKIPGIERIDPTSLTERILQPPWKVLEDLKKTLQEPDGGKKKAVHKRLQEKLEIAQTCLRRVIAENKAFTLRCKEVTFTPAFMNRNTEQALPLWKAFLDEFTVFCNRYYLANPPSKDIQDAYRYFLHSITQGLMVKAQIEFFGSAKDLQGDFNEMNRKLEIIFNMLKDESYWAELMLDLIDTYL